MLNELKIYKCSICGKIIEIIADTGVDTICCGQSMAKLVPNTVEASNEKHLPVAEIDGNTVRVKVGSVDHPMIAEHYIQWIWVVSDNKVYRASLAPNQKPEAVFSVLESGSLDIYEYCNLHGLWKATITK